MRPHAIRYAKTTSARNQCSAINLIIISSERGRIPNWERTLECIELQRYRHPNVSRLNFWGEGGDKEERNKKYIEQPRWLSNFDSRELHSLIYTYIHIHTIIYISLCRYSTNQIGIRSRSIDVLGDLCRGSQSRRRHRLIGIDRPLP